MEVKWTCPLFFFNKIASEAQHAMFALDSEGYDAISVAPITRDGQTVALLVCGKKRDE